MAMPRRARDPLPIPAGPYTRQQTSGDTARDLIAAFVGEAARGHRLVGDAETYFIVDMLDHVDAMERAIPGLIAVFAAALRHPKVRGRGSCVI